MPFSFLKCIKKRLFVHLTIVILPFQIHLVAQTTTIKKFTTAEGLSNDDVRDIHEDRFGYKWVSTGHGLNKYDGYNFEVFRHNPQDAYSLQANSQGRIFEDLPGNIWVTLDIGGVNKYDRASRKFFFYNYNNEQPNHLNNFVKTMVFDSKGRGWVGTQKEVNLIDESLQKFVPVSVVGKEEINVLSIYESNTRQIWVTAIEGVFLYSDSLNQFEPVESNGFPIKGAYLPIEIGDSLWLAVFNEGVYRVHTSNQQVSKVNVDLLGSWISNVFQTSDGSLTISVPERGIYQYVDDGWKEVIIPDFETSQLLVAHENPKSSEFLIVTTNNEAFRLRSDGVLEKIIKSDFKLSTFWLDNREATIWLGSRGGGVIQASSKPNFFDIIDWKDDDKLGHSTHARIVGKTTDGGVYLSTEKGLIAVDAENQKVQLVLDYSTKDFYHYIRLLRDNGENIMLATDDGFFFLDKKTKALRGPSVTISGIVSDFLYDSNDSLWVIVNEQLFKQTPNGFTSTREWADVPVQFKAAQGRKLFVDSEETMWLATVREGMFRIREENGAYDVKQFKYSGVRASGFLSQTVNEIFEDADSHLWIGGFSSGLMEFDRQNETWISHTPKGSMPIPNIQSIEQANDGALWISSINGLHSYWPAKRQFKHYTIHNGLPGNTFRFHSSTKTETGKMFFGSTEGITYFDPSEVKGDMSYPDIQIESVRLFDEQVEKDRPIQQIDELEFRYNQNFIGFDFIAIDYLNPNDVVYSYKLEGVDDSWSNSTKLRSVNYASLSPGTYTFKVRAGRDAGDWGPVEASLTIEILSPFWQRWWFYSILFVFICSLLYAIHQYRVQRKIQRLSFMESTRKKAAADFHDEMGNKLTRIALFSEVLERQINGSNPDAAAYVEKIKHNSRNLNNSMRDFLWALDPKKDSAYDLASMLKDFGEELFDKTSIAFSVDQIPTVLQGVNLTMDWKRHLIMTFKEAMHNVLKHAEAKNVSLSFNYKNDRIEIVLTDNGKGFDLEKHHEGYGLRNMKSRVNELAANIEIQTKIESGTKVIFSGKPSISESRV
ncbi:hypothetical protein BFP97_15660 [Roseivirga sp. 4D4]|uniref:ligand-binding sensor domain-containing protein n=1 Tax=Roseivirga sp. 4D4 TaxID=1889784 RepID=UPI000852FF13|nr:sensor histidine kinase [Roseivirga sp. 4D4]OEK02872.1 hypothetical protein BFP97_15660 [Roseivirga sp. 4D4]